MREMMGLVVTDHFKRMVDSVLNKSLALIEQTNLKLDQVNPDQLNPDQVKLDQVNPDQVNPDCIEVMQVLENLEQVKPDQEISDAAEGNPNQVNRDQTNTDQVNPVQDSGNLFTKSLSPENNPNQQNQIKDRSINEESKDPAELHVHFEHEREGQAVEIVEDTFDGSNVELTQSQTNEEMAKPIEITIEVTTNGDNEKNETKENENKQMVSTKSITNMQNGSTSKPFDKLQNGTPRENDLHKINVNNQLNMIERPKPESQRNGSTPMYRKYVSPVSAAKSKFSGQKSSKMLLLFL